MFILLVFDICRDLRLSVIFGSFRQFSVVIDSVCDHCGQNETTLPWLQPQQPAGIISARWRGVEGLDETPNCYTEPSRACRGRPVCSAVEDRLCFDSWTRPGRCVGRHPLTRPTSSVRACQTFSYLRRWYWPGLRCTVSSAPRSRSTSPCTTQNHSVWCDYFPHYNIKN